MARRRERLSEKEGLELILGKLENIKPLAIQAAEVLVGREEAEKIWNCYFKQVTEKTGHFESKINNYETAFYMLQGAVLIYEKRKDQEKEAYNGQKD